VISPENRGFPKILAQTTQECAAWCHKGQAETNATIDIVCTITVDESPMLQAQKVFRAILEPWEFRAKFGQFQAVFAVGNAWFSGES